MPRYVFCLIKNLALSIVLTWVPVMFPSAEAGNSHLYQVVKVLDGDTFDATDGNIRFRVRIVGMDAPEKGTPFSKLATVELQRRIKGKKLEIRPIGTSLDRYNRILGQVIVDGRDVGIELIEMGIATYFRPGCVDYPANKKLYDYDPRPYIAAEISARAKQLYLWSDPNTVLPCKVRNNSGRASRKIELDK